MASVVKRPAPIPRWFWFASMLGCTPGFKRSRCKKLLKVTMSRIKLLRGRREVQVRQLRRDVAQLLQLGQVENAENRVDRLWKEQSLLSAYIKTGEYCQLVKANLSNIALPRECPVDLKEPIASLCFAASCCADLPELQEIRNLMVLKYGKDFLLSAHELLPGKFVNKTILEAFATQEQSDVSRKALLKGILKEYNVVQPKKPNCPPSHKSQQSRDGNVPYSDCNQHHSPLGLEKEEKRQSARQTPSRPTNEGVNGKLTLNGEAKHLEKHKPNQKIVYSWLEEGTTETPHGKFLAESSYDKPGRARHHKRNTVVDHQVGEGDQQPVSKRKSNNKSSEPECAVVNGPHGYCEGPLPEDTTNSHSRRKGKVRDGKVRTETEAIVDASGQYECGEASPLRVAYEQIHGEDKPSFKKSVNQVRERQQPKSCNEALSQDCKANDMQQERSLYYEEQDHVERGVYSRTNGNSRSKRVMHDFEQTQRERRMPMPHSDCDYTKIGSECCSKSNGRSRPASECDNMQKKTSSNSHHRQKGDARSGVAYEFDIQQPSRRDDGALTEHRDTQRVQKERKHSSKNRLQNESAEMEGSHPNTHVSRKKHERKHQFADRQEEVGTDFSKVLPNQAVYKDYNYPVKETKARETSKDLHETQSHATKALAKTETEMSESHREVRLHESAVAPRTDVRHVSENPSIHARQRQSRRTKKHDVDHVSSRRKLLNGNSMNEESLQDKIAEEGANGKAFLPVHPKGLSTLDESTQGERRRFPESADCRELERVFIGAEVNNGHYYGYNLHQMSSIQKVHAWPENLDDHEETEVKKVSCQSDKGSPLLSRFSKPPDRLPPPVPSYRVTSLPNRQPLNIPVLPQRSATLETSHVRVIEEPHVHPKLPEYEDLVASFAALKNKSHQQPHSSSSS